MSQIEKLGDGRIKIDGEIYVSEKSKRVLTVPEFEERDKLKNGFYMNICRAFNAGKQAMNDQHTAAKNGDPNGSSAFVSSHEYFTTEFPSFTTNVP